MKKVGRILLWILGGIFLLACIFLLGVNLYVQSQGVHHRIQQELSQRLGTPLRLRQISVTPWNGLKLNGITIPQTSGKMSGDFLTAESFQLRVQFWSLFSDQLVIRKVSLIRPEVTWAQNAAGKWRLPELPAPKPPPMIAAASPNKARPAPATTQAPALPASPAAATALPPNENRTAENNSSAFTPEVQRVTLQDGDFTFLDSAGRIVAKFMGLDFRSSFRTSTEITGDASVSKISLRDRFFLEELRSPLRYDPAELAFSGISAHAAGGTISGQFSMELQTADTPFSARVKFQDLQAEKLITNAGGPAGMIQGRLEGYLNATGKTADANALAGEGEIVLRGGKVQQYSLLVALGQILQIDELMQLQLEQAEVKYQISPGIVRVNQLILRSPNIRLTATGTINFGGKLHLDAQLALSDKIRRQLFTPIRENFKVVAEPAGYAAVDFKVSGTVEKPKTDLMDKLVGRDLRDLGGVISSLFGHPKKKKPVPTPKPSPSATPAPSPGAPSPSPSAASTPSPTAGSSPAEISLSASPSPTLTPLPNDSTPALSPTPPASP